MFNFLDSNKKKLAEISEVVETINLDLEDLRDRTFRPISDKGRRAYYYSLNSNLRLLKEQADKARILVEYNPIAKRGIEVRNAYIWNAMPDFNIVPKNLKYIFEPFTKIETLKMLERSLCTDGQFFILINNSTYLEKHSLSIISLDRVGEVAYKQLGDYYDKSKPMMYQVSLDDDKDPVWVRCSNYKGNLPSSYENIKVNKNYTLMHVAVNKQLEYCFGIPDLAGAVYWANTYKKYLESCATYFMILTSLAFKVSNNNVNSKNQAIKAIENNVVNPASVGGFANLSSGQDLLAINKSGSGVDFDGGSVLAGMVASSLDIPLSILLTNGSAGGRQGAEAALEDPTFKTLDSRRRLYTDFFNNLLKYFGVKDDIKFTCTDINNDPTHRRMQSIMLAYEKGLLSPNESRETVLSLLTPPKVDENYIVPKIEYSNNSSVGALSDGTNDSRNYGHSTKRG